MAENNKSKFIFTDEGRSLLVSQTGGIKFAILGYLLVEGLAGGDLPDDVCPNGLKERWESIEERAKDAEQTTIEYLIENDNVTFLMRGLNYTYKSAGFIEPTNRTQYDSWLKNYKDHLFGSFYVPSTELMTDNGNRYGTYAFNFDRTYINCEIPKNSSYQVRHILLIGKQFAENKEATFNVHPRQDVGIVGVAEIIQPETGAGIQILANQNDYVTFQCQLRFTVTECENEDIWGKVMIDDSEGHDTVSYGKDDEEPVYKNGFDKDIYEPVSDIASKLALVNNGLKTLSGGVTIGQTEQILDDLQLGPDGAICMTKTLTVADCIDADDAENQFNAAALLHPINKYPDDGKEYVPQVLMTSVHSTSALNEDITAYSVGMTVKCEGKGEPYFIADGYEASVDAPIFKLGHVPENDQIAVDIFGIDNKINGYSKDRFIFSTNNSATVPGYGEPNVVIDSHNNAFTNGVSQNDNSLYYSNKNTLNRGAKKTLMVGSHFNHVSGGEVNMFLGGDDNTVENANNNYLVFSDSNYLVGNSNMFIDSYVNSAVDNASEYSLYTSRDNKLAGNSYNNVLFKTNNTTLSGTTTNSLFINTVRTRSYEDTKAVSTFNVKDTTLSGAYEDTLIASRGSRMVKSYFNGFIDNAWCRAVSAEQNTMMRSRYVGVKGLPLGSIDSAERPILSDVQSNNNIILGGEYFDLYSCSNNLIMDSYKLQSDDNANSLGPVRIKGSSIINSSKSKLFNAREVHLLNSEYTRVNALSNFNDAALALPGTSLTMGSTNELDSIYYGEFYNNNDYYAYYGLKGSSYKSGAASLKTNGRPADMLKLKLMFINSFGSEVNLASFNPSVKTKKSRAYNAGDIFKNQNVTLNAPTVSPQNTNVLGGHHNKIMGGKNTVILGGEYCKASTYGHQVLMGKYNRDVPADIIFGCGHFNGDTYTQGSKEYQEYELETIETMSGTIDGVRGDTDNDSGETCYNALEFYAHQGKMILQNCDDGHDAGTNAQSNDFGKSVTIEPTKITFRDRAGDIVGEINADANKVDAKWTFLVNLNSDGDYVVESTIGVPSMVASLDGKLLASYLFAYVDTKSIASTSTVVTEAEIITANNALFATTMPSEINVIIRALKHNTERGKADANWVHINKILPWYTKKGSAPKYIPNCKVKLCYYHAAPVDADPTAATTALTVWMLNTLNTSCVCNLDANITTDHWKNSSQRCWTTNVPGCIPMVEFNSNVTFTDWIADGFLGLHEAASDTTSFVTVDYLTTHSWSNKSATVGKLDGFDKDSYALKTYVDNGKWSNSNATVGKASNSDKVNGISFSGPAVGTTVYLSNP